MNRYKCLLRRFFFLLPAASLMFLCSCMFPPSAKAPLVSPHIVVQKAPSSIELIELTISGPEMLTINETYTTADPITIEVPAGDDRLFELQISNSSMAFRGSDTVDLTAGEDIPVTIVMSLYETTKLIIPDMLNGRLVRIDDMTGSGWDEITVEDLNELSAEFMPYDVDYDDNGRIYIAINNEEDDDKIIRIDDWNRTNETTVVTDTSNDGIEALTVDRVNNYIYYVIDNLYLHRCDLDGGSDTPLTTIGISDIRGLAVDENGLVYIAHGNALISAYDPVTQTVLDSEDYIIIPGEEEAWDVMVQSGFIYGAIYNNYNTQSNNKIVQLTFEDGSLIEQDIYSPTPSLFGPHRFVGTLQSRIYFIDEHWTPTDRIAAMDNIAGDNFEEYGATGNGVGQFNFF